MGNQHSQRLRTENVPQPTQKAPGVGVAGKKNSQLWHLYGRSYDFSKYVAKHPGGKNAILCAKGLPDCTAMFESYHPTPPRKMLDEFESCESTVVIKTPHEYTFDKEGFYNRLRRRVRSEMIERGYGSGYWKAGPANITFGIFLLALQFFLRVLLWNLPAEKATAWTWPLAMAITMGVARGLTITRMSHSASHHAFCRNPTLNQLMYRVCMTFMGGSCEHWTNQHVQRHHLETNIIPVDYDTMYPLKRVIGDYKPKNMHRFQHIYMWCLYPLIMVPWCLFDVVYAFHPRVKPLAKAKTLTCSFLFMFHAWAMPFMYLQRDIAWAMWTIELIVSSTIFFCQFVVNHEVPGTEGHTTAQDWGMYQVRSSHDFGIVGGWKEWLVCHMSGGLNNQIAHHLFPSTHFRFYPIITRIIRKMCQEENIPFLESRSVFEALGKHQRHLYEMGNPPTKASMSAASASQKCKAA